jgi:hypothetical protein
VKFIIQIPCFNFTFPIKRIPPGKGKSTLITLPQVKKKIKTRISS